MPDEQAEVFISFANADGRPLAQDLRDCLEAAGIRCWLEPEDMQGGEPWKQQILDALDKVRFMLLVLTKGALGSEWVPWEWKSARSRRVRIVPVMPDDPAIKPDIQQIPQMIRHVDFWKDPSERGGLVLHIKSRPEPPLRAPFLVPDKPKTYVQRTQEYEALRDLLLDKQRVNPVAITTAIEGGGGFGKSTLAKALCHDDDIYNAFTDGIVWVELGPGKDESSVIHGLSSIYRAFTAKTPEFASRREAASAVAETLRDLTALIVIDDVWRRSDLADFIEGGPQCARLFTTRRHDIVADVNAAGVAVDRMKPDESVDLVEIQLDERWQSTAHRVALQSLARRVGEMPIMLALAGKALNKQIEREGGDFVRGLHVIEERLERKGVIVFDPRDETRREYSIARTIEVSFEFLRDVEPERTLELGIFPPETPIPFTTLTALWGLDKDDTELLAEHLADLALATISNRQLRLHDVVRRYLAERLAATAGLAPLHARLIDGWGDLHNSPDEFAWRHVAHHLIEAGRKDRLRELLLDYRWLRAKLRATDPIALRDDAARFPDDPDLRYLARALNQSAHVLAREPAALRGQLYGRLMGVESPGVLRLVEQIGKTAGEGPWLRPLRPALTTADSPLLRVVEGHSYVLKALALTADGRTAVSGSLDMTVRVWDLATGQSRALEGHSDQVTAVALTADGRTAVSGSWDNTVRVWDLATGQSRALEGHSSLVTAVALTADGRTAVSGSWDNTVRVWDLATGQSRALEAHRKLVTAVALTADGRTAVSGSDDKTVRVWDLATGRSRALEGHSNRVTAVALTADGRTAVSGSDDKTVRVWDLATGQSRALAAHRYAVNAVALTADGRTAVSGSDDKTVRVWDLATGRSRALEGHSHFVRAVALSADGRTAVSGSDDKTVRVWDLATGQSRALEGHSNTVNAVALTADGRTAVSGSDDDTVRVWDLATGQWRALEGHSNLVNAVALTADGRIAVSGSCDRTVRVWDLATGQSRILEGHSNWVSGVALTADGRTAVSGSDDKTVRVWDVATGQSRALEGHSHAVNAVALTADGRTAVSGSDDRTVRVWNVATGKTRALEGHSRSVYAVALSADGRTAVSGSYDQTVRVWDLATGQSRALEAHRESVNAVAVTPDGGTAVSGSDDGAILVWDVSGNRAIADFHADAPIHACAVSADGQIVVAGDRAGRVLFLKLER